MKQYWQNLEVRERIVIIAGAIVALALLFFVYVWQPLTSSVQQLSATHQQQIATLKAVEHYQGQLQALQRAGFTNKPLRGSLLSMLKQSLKEKGLANYLAAPLQQNKQSIAMQFKQVPFDQLMQWMRVMWLQYGLEVQQFQGQADLAPGSATVSLSIQYQP